MLFLDTNNTTVQRSAHTKHQPIRHVPDYVRLNFLKREREREYSLAGRRLDLWEVTRKMHHTWWSTHFLVLTEEFVTPHSRNQAPTACNGSSQSLLLPSPTMLSSMNWKKRTVDYWWRNYSKESPEYLVVSLVFEKFGKRAVEGVPYAVTDFPELARVVDYLWLTHH